MRAFEYASPTTKEQAVGLLGASWGQVEVLAGGTDLLSLMKDDVVHPRRLVNIKQIKEMNGVTPGSKGLRIGALTTLGEVADNANVIKDYPALAEAINDAASPQIRNMATLGGNLCQRPRCWYFRGGFGLLPKNESGKDLITNGENRYHAILGNDGPAKFVSPSSIAPVLIAYGAVLRLIGPQGMREQSLEHFYVIPKSENQREHDLKPNEILAEVILPPTSNLRVAHYEIRQKEAFDWPLAVAAVALNMNGSDLFGSRLVLGYVAPIPWRAGDGEAALNRAAIAHGGITEEAAKGAAEGALQNATPLSHNTYKVQLAKVAVKRVIMKAASGSAA
ncbi:MAG TPA: FAD binding domain-containing protein [Terriglobales bacterium]|jgi:xanthine dehydrogenase YagS FAD-binding subunit|nr:FAD binding domain-containing protein [Terriglobales bacterium]